MTVMKQELRAQGLPVSGVKRKLLARLGEAGAGRRDRELLAGLEEAGEGPSLKQQANLKAFEDQMRAALQAVTKVG